MKKLLLVLVLLLTGCQTNEIEVETYQVDFGSMIMSWNDESIEVTDGEIVLTYKIENTTEEMLNYVSQRAPFSIYKGDEEIISIEVTADLLTAPVTTVREGSSLDEIVRIKLEMFDLDLNSGVYTIKYHRSFLIVEEDGNVMKSAIIELNFEVE